MSSVFDEWSIDDARLAAQQALYPANASGYAPAPKTPSPGQTLTGRALSNQNPANQLASYRAFTQGDHFQDWAGWVGPLPLANDPDAQIVRDEIERGFISRNCLGEVVGRHVSGCLGRDIKFSLLPRRKLAKDEQPSPDEQSRIDVATDLLTKWVDDRKLNQEYDKMCETLLIAGCAYQRPFVAPGEVDAQGLIPQADLATSLNRVYFNFPQPGEAVVWTDPGTQQRCSIYLYRAVTSSRPSVSQGAQGEERAELTYLDGDQTIVRILGASATADNRLLTAEADSSAVSSQQSVDYSYPLGKRLLMSDLHRRPLLNPQVVSLQKLINLALTNLERNTILGGFLERCALNGQMNGHYDDQPNGTRKFVYDELPVGAGAMTTLTGVILRDANGNETITSPNMLWRDPVSTGTFIATIDAAYQAILAECNQLHYSMTGDSGVSGISRQVAMAAYLIDLLQTKQQIDLGFSWLLETALALAAVLSGQPGLFDDLRVAAECSVDAGPISETMITVTSALLDKGQLSHETGLEWMGVEDAAAEIAAIDNEKAKAQAQAPVLPGLPQPGQPQTFQPNGAQPQNGQMPVGQGQAANMVQRAANGTGAGI